MLNIVAFKKRDLFLIVILIVIALVAFFSPEKNVELKTPEQKALEKNNN